MSAHAISPTAMSHTPIGVVSIASYVRPWHVADDAPEPEAETQEVEQGLEEARDDDDPGPPVDHHVPLDQAGGAPAGDPERRHDAEDEAHDQFSSRRRN